jgi:hypothetical protein
VSVSPRSVATGSRRAAIPYAMGCDRLGRGRRIGVAGLVGAVVASCAARASAQDAEPVRLAYDAPAGCPTESDFRELVARDGGALAPASNGGAARSVVVHIESSDSIVGTLVVRAADGTGAAREIHGDRCEDVARSLAVLVALVAEPALPAPPAPGPPATVSEAPAPLPPAVPPPAVPGLAAPVEGTQPDSPEFEPPDEEPSPHRWRLGIEGEGTLTRGVSPGSNPGIAGYVELADVSTRVFAPTVRLGVELAADEALDNVGTYRRFVGRLDACPWQAALARPWSDDAFTLQACARIDVGRIEVDPVPPTSGPSAPEVQRLWVAPAGLVRVGWRSPSLFLALEGGVACPLLRQRFWLHDDALEPPAFTLPPPLLTWTAGLGMGGFFL